MAPLTVEDRLLKTLRIEKGWAVDRMIAEFPVRQWKRRTLCYFIRRILILPEVLKGCLEVAVVVRWELTQTSSWLVT